MMRKLGWLLVLVGGVAVAAPPSATLTWVAPTKYTDGTTIPSTVALSYSVYQGLQGAAKTKVAAGVVPLTYSVTTGLSPNTTVCWEVTTTAGGQESARSVEACKTFPPQVAEAPTGLVVQ